MAVEDLVMPPVSSNGNNPSVWWSDNSDDDDEDERQVSDYDITAAPNDFNTLTMVSFIESGAVVIPGFQRNYVWDIKRASKLIESMIIGLPIPQVFLYEEARNRFIVIDGQQRLMSLYYFTKQRFPRKEKRAEIRRLIAEHNNVLPESVLHDEQYFQKFSLQLPEQLPDRPNRFNRLNYATLGDHKNAFDLRVMRNVIIKQNSPPEDDSSIYEIFNRLNTGGINLTAQEIRASMYHSDFYNMLVGLNILPAWRAMVGDDEPDLHMKDLEILLRGFALMNEGGEKYSPSMTRFLNAFSLKMRKCLPEDLVYARNLFRSFLSACEGLPSRPFHGNQTNKFNISTFDAVFAAVARRAFLSRSHLIEPLDPSKLEKLKQDSEFVNSSQEKTTSKAHVKSRIDRASLILLGT